MSSIKAFIKDTYENKGAEKLLSLLAKYKLQDPLDKILDKLSKYEISNDVTKKVSNAVSFLSLINPRLKVITVSNEKQLIEYLIKDLIQPYINEFHSQHKNEDGLKKLSQAFKETCELHGYDYLQLAQLLNLEMLTVMPTKKNNNYWYETSMTNQEIDELARDLKDKRWILSPPRDFGKLFRADVDSVPIECVKGNEANLLVLFNELRTAGLIVPKGTSGQFAPFYQNSVDNENKKFFKKPPNKIHDRIKRNSSKYAETQDVVRKLIRHNVNF